MKSVILMGLVVLALGALVIGSEAQAPGGRRPGKLGGRHGAGIPWSKAEGRPNIQAGHTVGVYIWHEGNEVFVVSGAESDKGVPFAGHIVVQGGKIEDPHGIKDEGRDRFKQLRPNSLGFRFVTHEALDGVKFHVDPGQRIAFKIQEHGQKTGHIFYGPDAVEAPHDPAVFDMSK